MYTITALKSIVHDLKRIAFHTNYILQLFGIAYLLIAIFVPLGHLFVNIPLLVASIAFLVFFFITYDINDKETQELKKTTRRIYSFFKLAIKALGLGISIYSIVIAFENTEVYTVLLAALSLVAWLLQLLFEMIYTFAENRVDLFKAAIEEDKNSFMDIVKTPFEAAKNVVNMVRGVPLQQKTPTKQRQKMDKLKTKMDKLAQKQKAKSAKQKEKQIAKAAKKAQKAAKKAKCPIPQVDKKAGKLLAQGDQLETMLQKAEAKLKEFPQAGEALSRVPVMISMLRSYIKKEYTKIPLLSILGIITALLHFINPFDIIPDAIPVIGHLDDSLILSTCFNSDLDAYINWRTEREKNKK